MARYIGKDGVVEVGGNAVANITAFDVSITRPVAEAVVLGQDWTGHGVGQRRVTGTFTANDDPSDTTGQGALVDGATVALTLKPQGTGSGLPQIQISAAVISERSLSISGDEWAGRTFAFAADSDIDETAQT